MDERTDEMLIAETLTADRNAFEVLMERHEQAVFRDAFGLTGRQESALDVTQNVFTKAFESLESFGGRSSFRTWVLRIACNESINWSKRARREAARSLGIESISALPDRAADPEAELISRENRSRIRRAQDLRFRRERKHLSRTRTVTQKEVS
jgi:RNA polymerase sigma-70 factor (ECF subfamily)